MDFAEKVNSIKNSILRSPKYKMAIDEMNKKFDQYNKEKSVDEVLSNPNILEIEER